MSKPMHQGDTITNLEKVVDLVESRDQFECVICSHCLDRLESAGQLLASALCGSRVMVPDECEQCGGFLVDGETFRVQVQL